MADLKTIGDVLDIVTSVITIIGVPVGIIGYFRNKQKERKEHEYLVYDALDDKYTGFLNLCLQHPELKVYEGEAPGDVKLNGEQKTKRLIMYEILISILERAYMMFKDQDTEVRKTQWEGWEKYISDWMRNTSFRESWTKLSGQYETNFTSYMNTVYAESIK